MDAIRIQVPETVLEEIKSTYCKGGKRFTFSGFRTALGVYIRSSSKKAIKDSSLAECLSYFSFADNFPSVDSIQRFFNKKDGKGIFLKDERNLPNLICYYAFNNSWFAVLEQFGFREEELIIRKQGEKSLPFLTTFDEKRYTSEINFKSKYIPFVGRENELNLLKRFYNDKQQFSWWIILGPGGAGKSRLALTFCEKLIQSNICAGFLEVHFLCNYDWQNWEPRQDTFIIVDYVSAHYKEILDLIKTLESKKMSVRVRVLLLERYSSGDWWAHFETQMSLENITIWQEPLLLPELDNDDLVRICSEVYKRKNKSLDNAEELATKCHNIDLLNRPLFAILISIVSVADQIDTQNTIKLVEHYFNREKIAWRIRCQHLQIPVALLEKHKYLVVVLTIVRGLKKEKIKKILDENIFWLPSNQEFSTELFGNITHQFEVTVNKSLGFIEPDIVGEYFVLNTMKGLPHNQLFDTQIRTEIANIVWSQNSSQTRIFIDRVCSDFPQLLDELLFIFEVSQPDLKDEDFFSLMRSIVSYVMACSKSNNYKLMVLCYEKFMLFRKLWPDDEFVFYFQALCGEQCIKYCVSNNNIKECLVIANDIKGLAMNVEIFEISYLYIKTISSIVIHYYKTEQFEEVETICSDFFIRVKKLEGQIYPSAESAILEMRKERTQKSFPEATTQIDELIRSREKMSNDSIKLLVDIYTLSERLKEKALLMKQLKK